jgi:hypothetical protein
VQAHQGTAHDQPGGVQALGAKYRRKLTERDGGYHGGKEDQRAEPESKHEICQGVLKCPYCVTSPIIDKPAGRGFNFQGPVMKAIFSIMMTVLSALPALADAPHVQISNDLMQVTLYLPDAAHGFYRGTRFDWSGVVADLHYAGHSYYGPWFTKTDPDVSDFVFQGEDIVAGPCSAITGPVEEFGVLGYEEAKAGGTFLKIGVGVLRKPDDAK